MGPETVNENKDCEFNGPYAGRDLYITMYQDSEREFVVTHNANIKPVSYFTGRETELQELRQRVEEGRKSVLVSGMGGIGKTHICRKLFEEYLNKHAKGGKESFRHIGYIEYNGDMGSSLQNCLKFKQQDSPEQNQEAAWRELEYLASDGRLLLFVDNVNVTIGEDAGLGRLKNIPGAVVLTSRRTSFSKEFEPYKIGFLSTEQCKKVYERIRYDGSNMKVPSEEEADLEYVINKLAAGHTITIEFLAHLAMTKHWNTERLRDELDQNGFCLEYRDEEDKLVNIQKSYEALYSLSGLSLAEQNILEAFSVFPYIPLEAEICNQWLLADAGVSEDDDILMGLFQKGWLQFDWEQESYVMHPVFAQFIYEKYRPLLEEHQKLVEGCKSSLEAPKSGFVLECQKFIPFAESIIEKIDMKKDSDQIRITSRLAYLLENIGEYKRAEKLSENLLSLCKDIFGENHLDTVLCYNNLAYMYENQKKYTKATELYEKCLQISLLGEKNQYTAIIYNNLATLYNEQGKYEMAKELQEKCLQIWISLLGESHSYTAIGYNNLAYVYESQGEHQKAEELYKRGLHIREQILGEKHPDTAISYNNLAHVYEGQGEYKLALAYYLKAYIIGIAKLGFNHPTTQIVHENMKNIHSKWNPEGNFEQWLEEQMKESGRD